MKSDEASRLIPRREVPKRFGIPLRFLEIAAVRGDGPPFVKIGRLCFYRPSDLEHWLDTRTVSSSSDVPQGGSNSR